jgi:hypothetical protein
LRKEDVFDVDGKVARLRAAGFDIFTAPAIVAEPDACERMVVCVQVRAELSAP